MVQTLKRVYLYTAATFALLFTAGVTVNLLYNLLELAGLTPQEFDYGSGSGYITGPQPTDQQIEQSVVLFLVVAVLVGLLFGGGHYWLIRRDARSDPGADGGATRHLFLNALLALAALVGVPTALAAISDLEPTSFSTIDLALPLSFALVSALVFALVLLERARAKPASRAASIIRQIGEDGVQGILLIIASVTFFSGISAVITWVLVKTNTTQQVAGCLNLLLNDNGPYQCPPLPLLAPILAAIFAIVAWLLYIWLAAWSQGAVLQRVVWYAALGYGLLWFLYGIAQAIYSAVAPLFGDANAWQEALDGSLSFIGALLTGALIMLAAVWWLRRVAARIPDRRQAIQQGMIAVPAALSLAFFLAGVILILQGLVEQIISGGNRLDADGWALTLGILVAGLGYPFLWLRLRRASSPALSGPILPRRAYVLVALAGTAIGAVVALVITVYQIVAIALNLGTTDFLVVRQNLITVLALGSAALAHLWQLRADLRASHARAALAQPVPAPAPGTPGAPAETPTPAELAQPTTTLPETLEAILQDVYGGRLEPTLAAARIRGLPKL